MLYHLQQEPKKKICCFRATDINSYSENQNKKFKCFSIKVNTRVIIHL